MSLRAKIREKHRLLDEIIRDLEGLKKTGFENQYAIDENIKFFKAMYSLPRYFRWLVKEMPKIDGSRLLELSDFPLGHGRWESILQAELLEIEKWKFPDNLMQFRKELLKQINDLSQSSGSQGLLLMSLGSGPMEIERQIILALKKENVIQKIVFVGVDSSQASLDAAKNNLAELNIPIVQTDSLQADELETIKKKYSKHQFIIILLKRDVFALNSFFQDGSVDLIYHGQFKHHLDLPRKQALDSLVARLSNRVVEDDLLNNLFMFILPILIRTRWFHPILLNGAQFSSLRCPTKNDLKTDSAIDWQTKIFPDGYISTYKKV